MKRVGFCLGILCLMGLTAWSADVVIGTFESNGRLVFDEVANAESYRVEWSPTAFGPWTNFAGGTGQWLDHIPGMGAGIVTASVPMLYRVVATVTSAPPPAPGLVLIPAGSFEMGHATNVFPAAEGETNECPRHAVYVSAFYMSRYEVTYAEWQEVYTWALDHGYGFDNAGAGKATNHPVYDVNWYDVVKWCNARSEKEGRTPCYTRSGNVYKSWQENPDCNWSANGYRLPTEAEWEKAARGGAANHRFPWSDSDDINHSRANYYSFWVGGAPHKSYDKALEAGYHPAYTNGATPYTSPVGAFAPNGYGLYDMAGNLLEWCWDWCDEGWYAQVGATTPDTRGPEGWGLYDHRVFRGGSWEDYEAYGCRVSWRGMATQGWHPDTMGFRVVTLEGP